MHSMNLLDKTLSSAGVIFSKCFWILIPLFRKILVYIEDFKFLKLKVDDSSYRLVPNKILCIHYHEIFS